MSSPERGRAIARILVEIGACPILSAIAAKDASDCVPGALPARERTIRLVEGLRPYVEELPEELWGSALPELLVGEAGPPTIDVLPNETNTED